ncbi:MAG: heparinase II/III family protein [Xanthomonadales bacterium]|nr:heparinase II/III family protein [Xanthomonadales bacterium]
MTLRRVALFLLLLLAVPALAGTERPRLLMSADDVALIKASPALPGEFSRAVENAKKSVEPFLQALPDIPFPKDAGGGYTHEQHKRNSVLILNAGILYQLTGEEAHAKLVRDMLTAYADMYPALPEHPEKKNQAPGKLFWQSLNEAVWLVTSIQGYDAVYATLSDAERDHIENELFRPMVSFLSDQAPQTFDRIHNHGTWAVAAVGMTGYVLDEPEWVEKALYGLKKDGSAGFVRQMDELFSPDGYYSEGPYYQRYALMPFMLFAKVIERNEPERKIFEHRDGILLKAVDTAIQLSYGGYFFPVNDAIKDKGLDTIELCYGVSIAFALTGDTGLLPIADYQGRVVLTGDGFRLAQALEAGRAEPFEFRSMQLRDGPDGDRGALAILRTSSEPGHQALVFKATGQGLGHGHFDRLAWLFYDNGREVIPDYGAARFLNVVEKDGGRYLAENKTWAKQSIAHNTLVVDQTSHFGGDWRKGEEIPTEPLVFDRGDNLDITAARMPGAYEGVSFTRSMALLKGEQFAKPVVLDVLKVTAEDPHQYDLPLYFKGQLTYVSHLLEAATKTMRALGGDHGYQHLWLRATAKVAAGETLRVTWINASRFYSYTVLARAPMEALFVETGANDPDFNLRREQGLILRVKDASDYTFVSLLEPHGEYNGSREFTVASASLIKDFSAHAADGLDLVHITSAGVKTSVALSHDADPTNAHAIEGDGKNYRWVGYYHLFEE